MFKTLKNSLQSFDQNIENDYQLKNFDIPDLYKVARAHKVLLQQYVYVLAAISRMSFFVGDNEFSLPKEGFLRRFLYFSISKILPIRFFVWRPFVRYLAEVHIHRKLNELNKIYKQQKFLIAAKHYEEAEYTEWLTNAIQDLQELSSTISSNKPFGDFVKYAVSSIVGLFFLATAASNGADFIVRLFTKTLNYQNVLILLAVMVLAAFIVIPIVYVYAGITFGAKRAIFLNLKNDGMNIYHLENNLFELLMYGKEKEFPLDYFLEFITFGGMIYFFSWIAIQVSKISPVPPNAYVINIAWCYPVMFLLPLLADVFYLRERVVDKNL